MKTKPLIRSHTAAVWNQLRPVLAKGEAGRESDTGRIKYGNGFSAWADLPYDPASDTPTAYDGEPDNYVAADPPANVSATLEVTFDSTAELTFTAVASGAAGNGVEVTLLDPSQDSQDLALSIDELDGKVLVLLATDAGDAAVATVPTDTPDETITVTLDTAGSAAAVDKAVVIGLAEIEDPFGVAFPDPAGVLAAEVDGDAFNVHLTADGGPPGEIALAEDSGSLGEVTISQTAAYAGAWGDNAVRARVLITPTVSTAATCVASLEESTIDITFYLGTDADGLPVAESDDDVATAINAALVTASLDGYLEAASSTAGDFDTATADWVLMAGGVDAAIDGSDTAGDIATAIAGLDGIASAVASTPADTKSDDIGSPFSGGGDNYAVTTTAADIEAAFTDPEDPAYNADVAALLTAEVTSGSGLANVLDPTVQETAGGKDAGEDQAEEIGTPGWLGRLATDGTDVWTCLASNLDGKTPSAWVKTFTA